MNLDEGLRKLAVKVLGNEAVVDFASSELLPCLSSGELVEAKEMVWRFFKGELVW